MASGQIYKIHSDFYYVDDGINKHECKIREVLKKQQERVLVGDFVDFNNGVIESIINRKNYITRPSVANIDQIIIVSALKEPELDFHQLDRYIALAKYHKIKAILCFNKKDLNNSKKFQTQIKDIYKNYDIVFTSATEHDGIKTFEKLLQNKTSVLCGGSGAGKSSLVNALNPDLKMRTKNVSDKLQRGTHTTRHCEIVTVSENCRVVDTPGFSNVKFDFILPTEIDLLFDEISIFKNECKYSDCLHINETNCAVLKNKDKIPQSRYESYLAFIEEAKIYKDKVKNEGTKIENKKKTINNKAVAKISTKKRESARNTLRQQIYKEIE